MTDRILNQLPAETIKLLGSTQIITSVSTAVKELVENSLDADSRNIQVKLENYGFDVLEVKDDGYGISYINVQRMFLPGCTSKITCFNDLGKLQTYGFRGEALSALAKLSNVSVTTKTSGDNLAMTYVINHEGVPQSSKPSHITKGTIITAANLFGNLPVRKQYLSSKKKVGEELKKVEHVVQSLSVIHPELRISLIHNKSPIWQKNSVKGIKQSFMQVVGLRIVSKMEHLNELGNNILVDLIVPKKSLDNIDNLFTSSSQNIFLYVNRRPVNLTKISKVVMDHILLQYNHLNPAGKYAICLISIEVPPQELDVNLEPNKTKIFLKNENEVINRIDEMLSGYYGQRINRPEPEPEPEEKTPERQLEDDNLEESEMVVDEGHGRKRPRLEDDEPQQMGSFRNREFIQKNMGWRLEVIGADNNVQEKSKTQSLCSQINMENCTLTTSKEVGELNKLINENSQKLISCVNSNSEARLVDRNEIQSHSKVMREESDDVGEKKQAEVASNNEKPILPDWPVRQPPAVRVEAVLQSKSSLEESSNTSIGTPSKGEQENPLDVNFLDKIDMSDWSRGIVDVGGGKLEGGAILAKSNPGQDGDSSLLKEDLDQFDLSVQSVSSQMGKKELSAFTKFSRIMRPKILKEFPGILFTKVAGLLVDRWNALKPDEKKYYEKLSKEVDQRREIHKEIKTVSEVKSDPAPFKKKPKPPERKPERFEFTIPASLESILAKHPASRGVQKGDKQDTEIKPLGQLQPSGNWLYRKGCEIGHVRHFGLHELILSQRMLSNHSVPRQPTLEEIYIDEEVIGTEHWNVLISLDVEYDPLGCRYTVISPVITKNGFKIDLEKRGNTFTVGWITEVASMIPFYGLAELLETLSLYGAKGEYADLGSLRPTAVINYITNEAVRIVQQTPRPPDIKDLKEWIETWQLCLSHLPPQCLHCRDIFVPIYTVENESSNT